MQVLSFEFFKLYCLGLVFAVAYFLTAWPISIKMKKANIIDVYWGYSFFIYFVFYAFLFKLRLEVTHFAFFSVSFLWCARLGTHLLIRTVRDQKEDARYSEIKENWKVDDIGFWPMFVFQGLLSWLVSIPFAILATGQSNILSSSIGLMVILIGLLGEALADHQLADFKANAENRHKTCQVGLWKFSRHPNYFFEWLIWIGFFTGCLGIKGGWLSILSVLIMYRFLTKVSGAAYSEEIMLKQNKRPDYADYVRRTNAFFPWWPRA